MMDIIIMGVVFVVHYNQMVVGVRGVLAKDVNTTKNVTVVVAKVFVRGLIRVVRIAEGVK